MQVKKTATKLFKNVNMDFRGSIKQFEGNGHGLRGLIDEVIQENNIPNHFGQNANIEIVDKQVIVTIDYRVEVESPEDEKKLFTAYLFDDSRNVGEGFVFNKNLGRILGSYFYDDEFKQDYRVDENTVILKNEQEMHEYINSLNIDFKSEFKSGVKEMVEDYDYAFTEHVLDKFFEENSIKELLIKETIESITDTLPREEILERWESLLYQERH